MEVTQRLEAMPAAIQEIEAQIASATAKANEVDILGVALVQENGTLKEQQKVQEQVAAEAKKKKEEIKRRRKEQQMLQAGSDPVAAFCNDDPIDLDEDPSEEMAAMGTALA